MVFASKGVFWVLACDADTLTCTGGLVLGLFLDGSCTRTLQNFFFTAP